MSDCCLELCEFLMHFILLWLPTMFCLSRLFLSFTLISFVSMQLQQNGELMEQCADVKFYFHQHEENL